MCVCFVCFVCVQCRGKENIRRVEEEVVFRQINKKSVEGARPVCFRERREGTTKYENRELALEKVEALKLTCTWTLPTSFFTLRTAMVDEHT